MSIKRIGKPGWSKGLTKETDIRIKIFQIQKKNLNKLTRQKIK